MTSQSHPEPDVEWGADPQATSAKRALRRVRKSLYGRLDDARQAVRGRLRTRRAQALAAAFVIVLVGGSWLRFSGSNWDSGAHLHPDERFMSSVANDARWPSSLRGYLDVHDSPLSPYNTTQGVAYVYGTLPLFATKLVAAGVGDDYYGRINIVGRRVSALIDMATLLLVFLTALMLLDDLGRRKAINGALLAAAFYAVTVTAIQHAHFFTVDSWVTFFGLLTFYLAARELHSPVRPDARLYSLAYVVIGLSLGLTVACKVGGILVAIPVFTALFGKTLLVARWQGTKEAFLRFGGAGLMIAVAAYVAFRATSPYVFANSSWLDLSINSDFRSALSAQQAALNGQGLYPPAYQWLLTPRVWGPLKNLVTWQLGVPLGIAALGGLGVLMVTIAISLVPLVRRRPTQRVAVTSESIVSLTTRVMFVSFVGVVFLYFSSRFAHTGRYLLPIVPFLSIAAAFGLVYLLGSHRRLFLGVSLVFVSATALYAVAFHHIYTVPNTRVAASDWITKNVPSGESVANEAWDDALPVNGPWIDPTTGTGLLGAHRGVTVPVFDPDDGTKLRKLYDSLASSDYYVLSSPRAWRTIGRLPDRFPLMVRFYRDLFAGRLGFKRTASFKSEPRLLGVHLDDSSAEEAFWVYDHPPVMIFRRTGPISWAEFHGWLCRPAIPSVCA